MTGYERRLEQTLDRIRERFARHQQAALHFSGGKDSLAVLFLLRPWWDRTMVTWCNTGDAFPETEEYVRRARATVPHFREARSYVRQYVEVFGWPVDALSAGHVEPLRARDRLDREARPLMQLWAKCCYQNLWIPLFLADMDSKATLVFTGERRSDGNRKRSETGFECNGQLEYDSPLWGWSDADVWAYLEAEGIELPAHYDLATGTTSLDCMHCTARWPGGTPGQLQVLKEHHPEEYREVVRRLQIIRDAVARELSHLDRALHASRRRQGGHDAAPG